MRIPILIATAVVAVTTGCSRGDPIDSTFNAQAKLDQQAAKERAADSRAVKSGFRPEEPAPMKTASVDAPPVAAPGAALPARDRQYRYIGRWATSAEQCDRAVWKIETRKLSAPDKTSCSLPDVSVVPTGYELTGTCRAAGGKSAETIKLSFDEAHRTMHLMGKALRPVDLLYCGN